ncbi:serine/threonine-protein kinase STY13-like [Salvia hispanica]|uniref:serine/threonine-protein kinase STY13-like n=1 Tax=Salvia hispanica TaxID=49212 RepID=UPI0020094B8F|nr:serine/threonine-protein kinase STY13-like [Salvia hispanica]XP_047956942.1 serine/threonine-protein kinase STY13-like [Salvia hispanica]
MGKTFKKPEAWEIDPNALEIRQVIAQGIYRGTYMGQDVDVKLLDLQDGTRSAAEIIALFKQEVSLWHRLSHPNISYCIGASIGASQLKFPASSESRTSCFVVTQHISGGTLKNHLFNNRTKKLPFKAVIQFALDLAKGLCYIHAQKIVHRDIKAENMVIGPKGRLQITGFGVARVEAKNPSEMTGTTGTLGYMAPEVLDGKPYNHKCDVYSFGICLWEMYCCDVPYPDRDLNLAGILTAVVKRNLRPEIPRCCPSSFASIMKRCWDANPNKRPEMEEVVKLLESIDTSKGGGMIPENHSPGCLCFARARGP